MCVPSGSSTVGPHARSIVALLSSAIMRSGYTSHMHVGSAGVFLGLASGPLHEMYGANGRSTCSTQYSVTGSLANSGVPSAAPGKESKERLADLPEVSEVTVSQVMVEVEERLSKQEKEDESLERRAVAKSERPWLQLVTILVLVTIVILSVVAWRLDLLLSFNIQPFGA